MSDKHLIVVENNIVTSIVVSSSLTVAADTNNLKTSTNIILEREGNVNECSIGDSWDGTHFISNYEYPVVLPVTVFTHLEIMSRFTTDELSAIYTAAKTTVAVEVWLDMFKLAQEIDVTNPQTISGMNSLEAANLLAPGRAAQILATA